MTECLMPGPVMSKNTEEVNSKVTDEIFSISKHLGMGWSFADNPDNMFTATINGKPDAAHIFPVKYTKDGEQRQVEILRSRKMLLTVDDLFFFWQNKDKIPKKWKHGHVTFDGTTYVDAKGGRFVPCLSFSKAGQWEYRFLDLSEKISTKYAFAAL